MTTTLPSTQSPETQPGPARERISSAGRRRLRSKRLPIIVFVIVVVVAGGGYLLAHSLGGGAGSGDVQTFTVVRRSFPVLLREKGELKAAKKVDVKCEVEGRSTIIWLIEEGKEVEEGELLVRLASDQIDDKVRSEEIKDANAAAAAAAAEKEHEILLDQNASDLRKAELALEMARIEMKKYLEGDWEQTKLDLKLELERAEKVLVRSKADREDSRQLFEKKFITEGEWYNAQFEAFKADIDVQKAKLRKHIEETYTHPKELQQKESDVAEAAKEVERVRKSNAAKEAKSAASLDARRAEAALTRERLTKFREQQAKCEIRAPQAGLVVYESEAHRWRSDRQIAEGAEVYERQTILKLPDTSVMIVTVRIHEAKTDKIAIGQEVAVEVEGLPGQVFTGKVTKIAVLADSQNQWLNPELKEYETEITLDQTDAPLKPGVTARADIIVWQAENVLAVPIQSLFSKGGRNYVFRQSRGGAQPVEVQPGISSDEFVEITDGLSEDDRVLLAVSDDLRRTLPEVEPNGEQPNARPPQAARPGGRRPPHGARPSGAEHRRQGRPPTGKPRPAAPGKPADAAKDSAAPKEKPDGAVRQPGTPKADPDKTAERPADSKGDAGQAAPASTASKGNAKPTGDTQ